MLSRARLAYAKVVGWLVGWCALGYSVDEVEKGRDRRELMRVAAYRNLNSKQLMLFYLSTRLLIIYNLYFHSVYFIFCTSLIIKFGYRPRIFCSTDKNIFGDNLF